MTELQLYFYLEKGIIKFLTIAAAFNPGVKPIKTVIATLFDQDNCARFMTFVSTVINNDKATRMSQERTIDLKIMQNKQTYHLSRPSKLTLGKRDSLC